MVTRARERHLNDRRGSPAGPRAGGSRVGDGSGGGQEGIRPCPRDFVRRPPRRARRTQRDERRRRYWPARTASTFENFADQPAHSTQANALLSTVESKRSRSGQTEGPHGLLVNSDDPVRQIKTDRAHSRAVHVPQAFAGVRWGWTARRRFRAYWLCSADSALCRDAGGGTRTPDTRIMIPLRFGSAAPFEGSGGPKRGQECASVSVGKLRLGQHVRRPEPHEQLTRGGVARSKLFGSLRSHIAPDRSASRRGATRPRRCSARPAPRPLRS